MRRTACRIRIATAVAAVTLLLAPAVIVPPSALAAGGSRIVKARILDMSARRAEMRVDVAGRPETRRVQGAALLRGFRAGDLVVLTLDPEGTIVGVRSA